MQVLLKQVKIIDPTSPFNGQVKDVLVRNGSIESIRNNITARVTKIQQAGACISPGWMDIATWIGDPGLEHVETIGTASQSASKGGYTSLAMMPNTSPVIDSKSSIEYIRNRSTSLLTHIIPLGCVSQRSEGIELAELVDMHQAGAVGFSDGKLPIQNTGLLLKALEYVKIFSGIILNHPHTHDLAPEGFIHEGDVSVALGLRGIPTLSEVLMLKRDIDLLRYTGSRLHVLNVSTAAGVEQIRMAKTEGLSITCSTPALNLLCTDEQVATFDSNYKVLPPLRSRRDQKALRKGLTDGTIDCITSNHRPVDVEHKNLEFAYADFGISNLETAFHITLKSLGRRVNLARLINKLSISPRQILDIPIPTIDRGKTAEITMFTTEGTTLIKSDKWRSRSKNNPFINQEMPGKVLAVLAKDRVEKFV